MLNVFLQQAKLALDQWSVGGDKTNEPGSLKNHLSELLMAYPALQLLSGDAIYAQRPLLELLKAEGCDYLFQIKANQPDVLDALKVGCVLPRRRNASPLIKWLKKGAASRNPEAVGQLGRRRVYLRLARTFRIAKSLFASIVKCVRSKARFSPARAGIL